VKEKILHVSVYLIVTKVLLSSACPPCLTTYTPALLMHFGPWIPPIADWVEEQTI